MQKQLFTESGSPLAFHISPKSLETLRESARGTRGSGIILKGVPATILDKKNGNGRKYTRKDMQKALEEAKEKKYFERRRLICTADDHPSSSFVPPIRASHVVTDAYTKEIGGETYLLNDWLVLDTSNGRDLKALIDSGVDVGTSIRGLGRQDEETGEIREYEFLGCDCVGNPSAGTFSGDNSVEVVVEAASQEEIQKIEETLMSGNTATYDPSEALRLVREDYVREGIARDGSKTETVVRPGNALVDIYAIENSCEKSGLEVPKGVEELKSLIQSLITESSPSNETGQDDTPLSETHKADLQEVQALKIALETVKEQRYDSMKRTRELTKALETTEAFVDELVKVIREERNKEETYDDTADRLYGTLRETRRAAQNAIANLQEGFREVVQELEEKYETACELSETLISNLQAARLITESLTVRTQKAEREAAVLRARNSRTDADLVEEVEVHDDADFDPFARGTRRPSSIQESQSSTEERSPKNALGWD